MKNKILVIGPVTKDHIIKQDDNYNQIGGAVYYQSMTLSQLKKDFISIIQIGKNDTQILNKTLKKQHIIKYPETLEYTNIYDKHLNRTQKAKIPINTLRKEDIQINLNEIKYALISPLSPTDITPEAIKYIHDNNVITVLVAQGFLRKTDEKKNIIERKWNDKKRILKHIDIICMDEKEAQLTFDKENHQKNLEKYELKQIIITKGENGSTIVTEEKIYEIPAIATDKQVDPTGLGDTYIAAYITKLEETNDIYKSGLFASITAKEKLKTKGPLKTSRKELEKELNDYG